MTIYVACFRRALPPVFARVSPSSLVYSALSYPVWRQSLSYPHASRDRVAGRGCNHHHQCPQVALAPPNKLLPRVQEKLSSLPIFPAQKTSSACASLCAEPPGVYFLSFSHTVSRTSREYHIVSIYTHAHKIYQSTHMYKKV